MSDRRLIERIRKTADIWMRDRAPQGVNVEIDRGVFPWRGGRVDVIPPPPDILGAYLRAAAKYYEPHRDIEISQVVGGDHEHLIIIREHYFIPPPTFTGS